MKAFEVAKSDLSVNYVGADDDAINFLVTNRGSRPGIVTVGIATLKYPDPLTKVDIAPMLPFRPLVIDPGATVLITQAIDQTWIRSTWRSIYEADRQVPGHVLRCPQDKQDFGWVEASFSLPLRGFDGRDSEFKKTLGIFCGPVNCGWEDQPKLFRQRTCN
ncbi:hypothetical protein [Novosphingobium album (ex Liu et al. 2023)]|nr:hypothetical protein [Novosphingobium album (ex Liu et al. 2023)]